jgi:hypothetical protein
MPSPDAVVPRLAGLTEVLAPALTHGTTAARSYLERYHKYDPYVFATLTRYHALAKLAELRLDAREIDDSASDQPLFISLARANLGIHVLYDGIMVRVYKSIEGLLPVPASRTAQNFFNQQTEFFVNGAGDLESTELNLVYLWGCDKEAHVFNALQLACPKTGGKSRDLVQVHWTHDYVIVPRLLDQLPKHGAEETSDDFEDIPMKRIEIDVDVKKTMDQ